MSDRLIPFRKYDMEGREVGNTTITQDARIIQQVIKQAAAAPGNVTVNITYSPVGQQMVGKLPAGPSEEYRRAPEGFILLDFVESLEFPRLENLYRAAISQAFAKYGTQERAAQSLGVSRRVIGYWMSQRPGIQKRLVQGAE